MNSQMNLSKTIIRRQRERGGLSVIVETVALHLQHLRISKFDNGRDAIVWQAKGLLRYREALGDRGIEPARRLHRRRSASLQSTVKQHSEGWALWQKVWSRKPAIWDERRPAEPSHAFMRVADEECGKSIGRERPDGRRGEARHKLAGQRFHRGKRESVDVSREWSKDIARHKKVRSIGVSLKLRRERSAAPVVQRSSDVGASALQTETAVAVPMSEFMSNRESATSGSSVGIDRYYGPPILTDYPRFA